jgi:hypothetical protein
MLSRTARVIVLLFALLTALACSTLGTPTPGADLDATRMALDILGTQNAILQATVDANTVANTATPAVDTQATADAVAAQATADAENAQRLTQEAMPVFTDTPQATVEVEQPTPEVNQGTAQAQPMYDEVQELLANSDLRSAEGVYHPVADFDHTWFDLKSYKWWRTGQSLGNFVIRADVEWRATGTTGEAAKSGCGFVYGETDPDHLHTSFLAMDGIVHTYRNRGSEEIEMKGGKYYGSISSIGQAELMLVVEDHLMTFFVNGDQVVRFKDPYILSGNISLTVLTGSPTGFQCKMTNVGVWELK